MLVMIMPTVEHIITEAQLLPPGERRRLVAELMSLAASNPEDKPDISYSQRYLQAAQLIGCFQDIENATDLAAEHDRYLDASYR